MPVVRALVPNPRHLERWASSESSIYSTPLGFILAPPKELAAYCSACASAYAPLAARSPTCNARSLAHVNSPSVSATQPSLRLFSRRLWNSEHVVAIVHMLHLATPPPRMRLPFSSHPSPTMCAHPACISAWGRHYHIPPHRILTHSPPHTWLPLYHHSSCNK